MNIKFRVWDHEERNWLTDVDRLTTTLLFGPCSNGVCFIYDPYGYSRYAIQRSTHLKDGNEVEIWEGDIVEFKHEVGHEDYSIEKYTVEWEDGGFNIAPYFLDGRCEECEVLGNVLEPKKQ